MGKASTESRGKDLPALEPDFGPAREPRLPQPVVQEWAGRLGWSQWRCAGGRLPPGVLAPLTRTESAWADTVPLSLVPDFEPTHPQHAVDTTGDRA